MIKNDYIGWLDEMESFLKRNEIDFSEYDEFHINDVICVIEGIVREHDISSLNLTDSMVNTYTNRAIAINPERKDYYKTISCYVKKRFIDK